MGLEAALLATVGLGAATATQQVIGANQQAKAIKRQGDYNAQIYEQQASMIENQKKLQEYQDNREAARIRGKMIARAGGAGLMLSGSPLALLIDSETQMQLDKNIGQYNLEVQKRSALSSAAMTRYEAGERARLSKMQGYSNAFSTVLNTTTSAFKIGRL